MADPTEPTAFEQAKGRLPTSPNVPMSFLAVQFWRDIFGKEVQSAATYSYLWMADQMGHVALGIILHFALTFVLQQVSDLSAAWASGLALLGISLVVSFWEFRAYTVAAAGANSSVFPLDKTLLRDNAVIATAYMIFGVLAGYAFLLPGWWGALLFLVTVLLSIVCAPYWLRQKIIWQKASLPYLARLADLWAPVPPEQAQQIEALVNALPDTERPRQIVIAGPIGSGRTPMLTGLGTDLAFKNYKVRYMRFAHLLEIADQVDPRRSMPPTGGWGPKNIIYWPWFEAQVLLIDDVSPVAGAGMKYVSGAAFGTILNQGLALVREEFCNRHTVWVFALDEARGEENCTRLLDSYSTNVQAFCKGSDPPIVVRLPTPVLPPE